MNYVKNGSSGTFGLGNVSINDERRLLFDFSPAYIENVSLLVTNSNFPQLNSIEEIPDRLNGMKGYSIASSTNDERLKKIKREQLPEMEIQYFKSGNQLMTALSNTTDAFAILDLNFYVEALGKRMSIKRHSVCDEKGDKFGIVMPKGSDWTPIMEEFFNSGFINSTEYSQIIAENLGNSALRLIKSN